jgi:hypothetical protein
MDKVTNNDASSRKNLIFLDDQVLNSTRSKDYINAVILQSKSVPKQRNLNPAFSQIHINSPKKLS